MEPTAPSGRHAEPSEAQSTNSKRIPVPERQEIEREIEIMLADDRRSWQLKPDATWVRTETLEGREGTVDTFEVLKEDALAHGSVVTTPHRPAAGAGSLDPRA